jgi:hypothetical protein
MRAISFTSVTLAALLMAGVVQAQPQGHYIYRADFPPGVIGNRQLQRSPHLPGYFQPVEIRAPGGTLVSLAGEAGFEEPVSNAVLAGMLIGPVYRCKVINIPRLTGVEIYPTIEVIDRLYPPPGQAVRYPIPIELQQDELEAAASGQFVTRVIYLEQPDLALPVQDRKGAQRVFEVNPIDDPLEVADRLGRPMAILRMGSRIPDENDLANGLPGARCAPFLRLASVPNVTPKDGLEEPLTTRTIQGLPTRNFRRVSGRE